MIKKIKRYVSVEDVMSIINTPNRGIDDYFIVDQIEDLCKNEAKTLEELKDKIWNEEELEEKTEYWHTHPEIGCTLREYLGMTKKEYEAYCRGELPTVSFENSNEVEK